MFFVYSKDLFLLNKQVQKIITKINSANDETELISYSWIHDQGEKIYDEIFTPSFFDTKKIIIIKDAFFLTEKKKEKNWIENDIEIINKILNSNNLLPEIIFTLNEDKISNKLKITKEFQKKVNVIKINELSRDDIVKFVTKKFNDNNQIIFPENVEYFINKLPSDMSIIVNELTKILNLNVKEITKEIIDYNLTKYFENDVFKLSEYFLVNDIENFVIGFRNYYSLSSDLVAFFSLLNSNLTILRDSLILKKQGKSHDEIATLLNTHPFRIKTLVAKNILNINQINGKIIVLYKLNKLWTNGVINSLTNIELELVKNMWRIYNGS